MTDHDSLCAVSGAALVVAFFPKFFQRLGRKYTMMIGAGCFLVGAVLQASSLLNNKHCSKHRRPSLDRVPLNSVLILMWVEYCLLWAVWLLTPACGAGCCRKHEHADHWPDLSGNRYWSRKPGERSSTSLPVHCACTYIAVFLSHFTLGLTQHESLKPLLFPAGGTYVHL